MALYRGSRRRTSTLAFPRCRLTTFCHAKWAGATELARQSFGMGHCAEVGGGMAAEVARTEG
jgi:hypothetical protein